MMTNKALTNSMQYQIGLMVILLLSSFMAPFILLYPIQELLYRPQEYFLFEPFFQAYIILMAVLIAMAMLLLVNLLVTPQTEKGKYVKRGILGAFLALAGACSFLSINNYQFMDTKGMHMNHFFSLQADVTSWQDIASVEQINVKKNGVTVPDKLIFTLHDGSTIEQPFTSKLRNAKQSIISELGKYGLTIENKFSEDE
ncbi:hypothetical protein FOH38_16395 [Lysinibacillus fusiformis]|nr:hypothetical protein FOH38_16395 [Lysinibacillus fusiformis]